MIVRKPTFDDVKPGKRFLVPARGEFITTTVKELVTERELVREVGSDGEWRASNKQVTRVLHESYFCEGCPVLSDFLAFSLTFWDEETT